jgi:ferredoxin
MDKNTEFENKMKEEFEDVSIGTKDDGEIRRIVVDRTACIGARSCVLVAEHSFQMDDENLAYVPKDSSKYEDDETIKLGAQSCPVLAIHLYNEKEEKIFPD